MHQESKTIEEKAKIQANETTSATLKIKVGTLNYSGILTSPYEYYDQEDQQQKQYSQVFSDIVAQKYPDFKDPNPKKFSWEMGSIDPFWKKRYSPINMLECGVKDDQQMMNQGQFLKKWNEEYNETKANLLENYFKKKYPDNWEQKEKFEIGKTREFDLFCYQTILKVLTLNNNDKNKQITSQIYLKERGKKFSKSYLDEKQKRQKTIQGIIKGGYDICCFQETNHRLIEELENQLSDQYYIYSRKNTNSCIVIKKESFVHQNFHPEEANKQFINEGAAKFELSPSQFKKMLFFNKDSIFQALPHHAVVISIHLSSKEISNTKQMAQLKEVIERFREKLPHLHIIFAGDLNSCFYLSQKQRQKLKIEYYPHCEELFTANKKRTMMQPQRHKAEKLDQMSKDFIITDLGIKKASVQLINGDTISKEHLLPTDDHPYDHYMVAADIDL